MYITMCLYITITNLLCVYCIRIPCNNCWSMILPKTSTVILHPCAFLRQGLVDCAEMGAVALQNPSLQLHF